MRRGIADLPKLDLAHNRGIFTLSGSVGVGRLRIPVRRYMNGMKTTLLLGLLSGILIVGGRVIAGEEGLKYGLILAVGMNFFSYFFSEKIALMSAQAQPVS